MNRFAWLLALTVALLLGSIATRAQFETPNRSFHSNTLFPLTGRHQTVACESCHLKGVFKGTPTTCYDCHWVRRQDDKFKTQLGSQCENCHRTISWAAVRWDHGVMTKMPLNGAHRTIGCESCHAGNRLQGAAVSCVNCHQKDYNATNSPNHAAAGFPTACEACHRPSDIAFSQARFDHNASFPLSGPHATTNCASCHKNNVFKGTSRACASCHQTDYARAQNPNHAAAGFPTTCETCHRSTAPTWTGGGTSFTHATYPLIGQHTTPTCASCHKNNVFAGTPRDCVSCHRPAYDRTTAPNHVAAGFPTTCETCHRVTDAGWRSGAGSGFNHSQFFPLVGLHQNQACASCHVNNVFKGTARDCVGCHRKDYDRTTSPNHAAAGFATTCESCHRATDQSWRGSGFNHNQTFALVGRHATVTCAVCHVNNVFKGTARDCVGCHKAQYDATKSPNHAQAGFSTTCETCHKASDPSWSNGSGFNHNQVFTLVGRHATVACAVCHVNNVFKGTARDCVGCHKAQYDATKSPNHAQAGFSTTCETCHKASDASWSSGSGFNHNATFPLVGRHTAAACTTCHVNGVYKGTARTCVGCHKAKYDATRAPNHAAAGFSTSCDSCHKATDAAWTGVTFNHGQFFALQGAHTTLTCANCHGTGVYKGTPRTCVGCHQAKYNATRSPNHVTSGFPTTCETCHFATDTRWTQGRFTHTKFPLTGNHNVACAQCHTTNAPPAFSCLTCHTRSKTDGDHRGRAGYVYDSAACYSCHPNGRSGF